MRKWAYIQEPSLGSGAPEAKKIMVHELPEGTYVYLYESRDSVFCYDDLFYDDLESALAAWDDAIDHGEGWHVIDDPLPDCQHDSILPIRVKGRDKGDPQWGEYEILKDGEWVPFATGRQ